MRWIRKDRRDNKILPEMVGGDSPRSVSPTGFYGHATIIGFDYLGRTIHYERGVVIFRSPAVQAGIQNRTHICIPINAPRDARLTEDRKHLLISCRNSNNIVLLNIADLTIKWIVHSNDNTLSVAPLDANSFILFEIGTFFLCSGSGSSWELMDIQLADATVGYLRTVVRGDVLYARTRLEILIISIPDKRIQKRVALPIGAEGDIDIDSLNNIYVDCGGALYRYSLLSEQWQFIDECPCPCRIRFRNDGLLVASNNQDCKAWALG